MNVGVTCVLITMSIVVTAPHCPVFGVNVYVVVPIVDVFMTAGVQVPVIPLLEVVGNAGAVAFWHNGPICVNVGIICDEIVTSIVAVTAHCPASGVNVYVVVPITDVFITAGFHVPVMPLLEVVGNAGAVAFWQSVPIALNVGVICVVITISIVVTLPH